MEDEKQENIKRFIEFIDDPNCKGNFKKYIKPEIKKENEKIYQNEIWRIWEDIQKGR